MVASLRESACTETKEDESRTGRVWAAVSHHITVRSRFVRVFKLMNRLFLHFSNFFSDRGQLLITESPDTESAVTAVHLYSNLNSKFCRDVTPSCVPFKCYRVHLLICTSFMQYQCLNPCTNPLKFRYS